MVKNALNRQPRGRAPVLVSDRDATSGPDEQRDYFCERDGLLYAGGHLLVDMWGASNLNDAEHIERALHEGAKAAGASILYSYFHRFSPSGGVTGVVVLAESHITIHTWPERRFAAVDIFMCGACNPLDALPVLRRAFAPENLQVSEQKRGLVP